MCSVKHSMALKRDSASDFTLEEVSHLVGRYIAGDEGLADAAHQNECQLALAHLLVLTHQRQQLARVGFATGNILDAGWQTDLLQVMFHARGAALRTKPSLFGKTESLRHSNGNTFAVQEPV